MPPEPLEIPDYLSPEVDAAGRVTVRCFHPTARAVWMQPEWSDTPLPLHRDPAGLWSAVSPPLEPDIYQYTLFADGIPAPDLKNPWRRNGFASLVQVRGSAPAVYDPCDVPHGTTHAERYASRVTGEMRRLHLYTPPGYGRGTDSCPVLYLLHGSGDDDASWIEIGRVHWMLDNLIARGLVAPMIVAMPLGRVLGSVWKEERSRKLELFTRELHEEVIPFVESRYRTQPGAARRALAGLSMGGGQTLCAGLARPGSFGALGVFSAGLWPEMEPVLKPALAALRRSPPALLWIGIGRRDFLYPRCTLLRETLAGIPFIYHEDNSAHTWRAWRDFFARFAPLLFRTP